MRPRTEKRTVAILGVVTLLAISVGLALSWQEIQVKYHLHRLRNEPGYLKEVVSAPENNPQRVAMVEFLESDAGKERLFAVFLETYERFVSELTKKIVRDLEGTGLLAVNRDAAIVIYQSERGVSVATTARFEPGNQWLVELLPYLVGSSYSSDMDLVFSFEYMGTFSSTKSLAFRMEHFIQLGLSKDSIVVSIRPPTSDD